MEILIDLIIISFHPCASWRTRYRP